MYPVSYLNTLVVMFSFVKTVRRSRFDSCQDRE